MNSLKVELINRLSRISSNTYHFSKQIRFKICILNHLASECNSLKNYDSDTEFNKIIFDLLVMIPNNKNISIEFINIFSDLIIEVIESEKRQDKDISDLISAFTNFSISANQNINHVQ